jgi:hypothetical protein
MGAGKRQGGGDGPRATAFTFSILETSLIITKNLRKNKPQRRIRRTKEGEKRL